MLLLVLRCVSHVNVHSCPNMHYLHRLPLLKRFTTLPPPQPPYPTFTAHALALLPSCSARPPFPDVTLTQHNLRCSLDSPPTEHLHSTCQLPHVIQQSHRVHEVPCMLASTCPSTSGFQRLCLQHLKWHRHAFITSCPPFPILYLAPALHPDFGSLSSGSALSGSSL